MIGYIPSPSPFRIRVHLDSIVEIEPPPNSVYGQGPIYSILGSGSLMVNLSTVIHREKVPYPG